MKWERDKGLNISSSKGLSFAPCDDYSKELLNDIEIYYDSHQDYNIISQMQNFELRVENAISKPLEELLIK